MKDNTEKVLLILLIVSIICMMSTFVYAEKYLIIHPIENADGTPIDDLKGVLAHCGDEAVDLGMKTVWDGPKDCSFVAYDTSGNASEPWQTKIGIAPYPPIVIIYGE